MKKDYDGHVQTPSATFQRKQSQLGDVLAIAEVRAKTAAEIREWLKEILARLRGGVPTPDDGKIGPVADGLIAGFASAMNDIGNQQIETLAVIDELETLV